MTSGEYFKWGTCKRHIEFEKPRLKQAKEVMENRYAIQSDRRIIGADKEVVVATIPCFPNKKDSTILQQQQL
ncbi:hypothetical protein SUGI_0560300 [Cryptomeria japonica]|nr:hypothetical protein SUGI_0560300 [Cryptomeria japonica]